MNTTTRLAAYGAALALVFGAAWVTGSAVGPAAASRPAGGMGADGGSGAGGEGGASGAGGGSHGGSGGAGGGHDGGASGGGAGGTSGAGGGSHGGAGGGGHDGGGAGGHVGGLAVSEQGYTFVPVRTSLPVGQRREFAFRIDGPAGEPVRRFDVEHEKRLHLVVVRRDGTRFQHLHPELGRDGTWRVPLRLPAGGSYRAFADFRPTGGPALTLGVDLSAAGDYRPASTPPSRTATVDGYRVRLDGHLEAGETSELTATVTKDGKPVTDLEPYLGAYGHLVALRTGDLGYLHVHPTSTKAGPKVTFDADIPSAGTYRLFLDFAHGGQVRTADFTVEAHGH